MPPPLNTHYCMCESHPHIQCGQYLPVTDEICLFFFFVFVFFLLVCDSNIYTTEELYSRLICQFKVKMLWHTSWSDEAWQEIKVYLDAAVILLARRHFAAGSLHCKTLSSDHQHTPSAHLHGLGFRKYSSASMRQLKYCRLVGSLSCVWPFPS